MAPASSLFGDLAEVADVSQDGVLYEGVQEGVLAPGPLGGVEVGVEVVQALHGCRPQLAVAEDQVDPQVQVVAHILTLQGLRGGWGEPHMLVYIVGCDMYGSWCAMNYEYNPLHWFPIASGGLQYDTVYGTYVGVLCMKNDSHKNTK